MILNFTTQNFTLNGGFYYSSPFKIETKDQLMTIECVLISAGEVIIQYSLDESIWYDSLSNNFTCSPSGLQSYIECQPELLYRLKSSTEFISAKILL